ncbi:hemerythrin domain-containing protein [Pseudonocardia xishanensis]|uniref:Hemerythrin-like domain-containing protein n=1 Tax=Pseudonocardia xishanensis TaxID=630995 RepID=A0ABP8S4Y5_9PSEU
MTCPTSTPNLMGLRGLHRTMQADLHRLTALVERLADLRAGIGTKRAKALEAWVRGLCAEIHHHHAAEDRVVWPVVSRYADDGLADVEHTELGPLLDEVREAAALVVAGPSAELPAQAGALAGRLARLRDALDRHVETVEGRLFPLVERCVPADEWAAVVKGLQRMPGGPSAAFRVPRIVDLATPEEWEAMRAHAGPALPLLAVLLGPAHRRRERLVFG